MISRRRFLAAAAAVGVAGAGVAAELAPTSVRHRLGLAQSPDHRVPVRTEHVVSGTFDSAHLRRPVGWSIAFPGSAPKGVLFCLHARGGDHTMAFRDLHIPDVVAVAGTPLVVAACDGGADGYWHPRSDGTDALAMFFDEFVPLVDRQTQGPVGARALMGWSMGGYGALLFAEEHPELFRAVSVASAALWTTPGASAPGAFDSPADYQRWDVYDRIDRLRGMTVRVDCGTHDPFIAADRAFAARLPPPPNGSFTSGFHDAAYWRSVAPAQITTIATALQAF